MPPKWTYIPPKYAESAPHYLIYSPHDMKYLVAGLLWTVVKSEAGKFTESEMAHDGIFLAEYCGHIARRIG